MPDLWRSNGPGRAIACASALLPLAELILFPAPATARLSPAGIDIPAGPISDSLSILSRLTGVSVGLGGSLPPFRTPRVTGATNPGEALRQLLRGSGFHAVAIGPSVWRIEPEALPRTIVPRMPASPADPPQIEAPPQPDIIVTGQKRRQHLAEVPMSLTVISAPGTSVSHLMTGSRDVALDMEGLAVTNLGPGRNRQFIRGVADSPFDGVSQATVAVQLDEARLTYDAPDPDLRLTDMERIEVLKGPQGPLYGSGALGGIYHLVTRKPVLDKLSGSVRLFAEAVQHGGIGGGGEAVINLPLARDRLAVRAVVYDLHGAGWIDRDPGKHDSNNSRNRGGRLAIRWQPSADWTIDLGAVAQDLNVADSQYVTASDDTLTRAGSIAEPSDNDFREGHATIEGSLGGLRLVSATSYVDHRVDYTRDASAAAGQFNLAPPLRFRDSRHYLIFNQEVRLSPVNGDRWVVGASVMRAHNHSTARIDDAAGTGHPIQQLDRVVAEYAVFGEATLRLAPKLDATVGGRIYRTVADDEATEGQAGAVKMLRNTSVAPSLAISWRPRQSSIVYLRYARALRPSGLATTGQSGAERFDSDRLGTFDLGVRHDPAQGRLSFAASLYYTLWSHIQSDYLLANGLVSTRNAGRGQILGMEANADWKPVPGLRIAAGLSLQRARLTHTENGLELNDRRLPIAPGITGRLGVRYDHNLSGNWSASFAAQANYIGRARLALDDALDRKMGNYVTAAASATISHDRLSISARIDNLFDVKGDSFAFGNPFTILTGRQFTPLRPRGFTLSLGRSW